MTEREEELLGYISDLLHLSRRETRWAGSRAIWEAADAATKDDRNAIAYRKLREAGWIKEGRTWKRAA